MRLTVWLFSVVLGVTAVITTASPSRAQELHYTVRAGERVEVLRGWTCWHGDCSYAHCRLNTTTRPRLGQLVPRVSPWTIPATGGQCAGRASPGLFLTYAARRGASGEDRFTIAIRADNGHRSIRRYRITIQP